ncbi:hypothetical protein [Oceanobacillus oncorhynchi]|uniref:hypothetical protein n=1 Tax=Oceanobacillus oncorhynchi TaxID=545501 RepID=UPI0034D3D409
MTDFDTVWSEFIVKNKMDEFDIPNTDEAIHKTIESAVRTFNTKLEDNLSCDLPSELFSRELNDEEINLLSHIIRLITLQNQLIYQSTMFIPFTQDIGTRNHANQMSRLEKLVEDEEKKIDAIMLKMVDELW